MSKSHVSKTNGEVQAVCNTPIKRKTTKAFISDVGIFILVPHPCANYPEAKNEDFNISHS